MGQSTIFRSEDRVAIPAAIALHVAVVAVLLFQPVRKDVLEIPQRMSVSLASEVSLESTAPDPAADSRAALAPELSEEPAPVAVPDIAEPVPQPAAPTTRRNTTSPASPERPRTQPNRQNTSPAQASKKGGGSRIGEDFLPGQGSSTQSDNTSAPAATFGSRERADLRSAITRQLRKNWTAPNGVDAEQLVSIVRWQLNPDGSLKGRPTCDTVSSSITESNRPQAGLHCERAIRAVQLAAPFNLPEQFYSRWDDLEWQFDRRL